MPTNFYMFFVVGLIPLIIGAIYYHDKVIGNVWKKTNGFTDEYLAKANMGVIFGLAYLFSVLIAFFLTTIVIHQGGVFSTMMPEVMESGSEAQKQFNDLMAQYGEQHRGFSHGAIHSFGLVLMVVFPIISINALFERRGWKYVFIHTVYWLISLTLMGGLLCETLKYAPLT